MCRDGEDIETRAVTYWRNEARYASEKYLRASRIMRRFMWATAILGALLGISVTITVIILEARP